MEPIIYNGFIIQEYLCSTPPVAVCKENGSSGEVWFNSVDEAKTQIDEWITMNEQDLKLYERERKA